MGPAPKIYPPGTQFGQLTVIEEGERIEDRSGNMLRRLLCRCTCGNVKPIRLSLLTSRDPKRRTTTCGCGLAQRNRDASVHNLCRDSVYRLWTSIKGRCYNPRSTMYYLYGGRGIGLFEAWRKDPVAFVDYVRKHLGPKPAGYSIDRYPDKNGDYKPGNIRWASSAQQQANTRYNVVLKLGDREMNMTEWSKETGIPRAAIRYRKNAGWPVAQILSIKPGMVNRWSRKKAEVAAE